MDALILKKPNGTTVSLQSLTGLRAIDRAEQKVELLTGDVLSIKLTSTAVLDIGIGDTIEAFGQLYTLNTMPTARRFGDNRFEYELTLEGPQYHLLRVVFFDVDTSGNALSSTFTLTGNLSFFAGVLMSNMARVFGGSWGLGSVGVPGESTLDGLPGTAVDGSYTDTKTLSFQNENCLSVLQRLCTEWGTEFRIEYRPNNAPNRVLSIGPVGSTLSYTFQYGQGNPLYELTRRSIEQGGFYTKLYVFGGSKNLPAGYRGFGTRLQLPQSGPVGLASPWDSFVKDDTAIANYGLIEGTKVFEDIYPTRTGIVTASTKQLEFSDSSMNFNLMAYNSSSVVSGNVVPNYLYLLPGIPAKVHFQSGNLAGYEFELSKYDHATKTFTLKTYTDERGMVFPSPSSDSPFRIGVNDTYKLIDIRMPDEYVAAAEQKLLNAGKAYLMDNRKPAVEYSLILDELYWKKEAGEGSLPRAVPPNFFQVGDAIRLVDTGLGIDRMARITAFTRDALRPYRYTLTLGDTRRISVLQRVLAQQVKINTVVQNSGQNDPTVPVNTTSEPEKKDIIQLIQDSVEAAKGNVKHTLLAGTLPTNHIPFQANSPLRHRMQVAVWGKSIANLSRERLGLVDVVGRKRPFV